MPRIIANAFVVWSLLATPTAADAQTTAARLRITQRALVVQC
jgi:hypothetical protein